MLGIKGKTDKRVIQRSETAKMATYFYKELYPKKTKKPWQKRATASRGRPKRGTTISARRGASCRTQNQLKPRD